MKFKLNDILLVIGIFGILSYLYTILIKKKPLENFDSEVKTDLLDTLDESQLNTDTSELDNLIVMQRFENMTPVMLLSIFNQDVNLITEVFNRANIPIKAIEDPAYYPRIATLLFNKGFLKTQ